MRLLVLHLIFLELSCGGEDEGGEREEKLQSYQNNFSMRKREIADAITSLVEDVIQAEEESLGEFPGPVPSQNISRSKFQDTSGRIKEEVSIEVLSEKDLSRQKRKFSPRMRTAFERKKRALVKTKQVDVYEQGKIKEGSVKDDTSKEEDKFVVHEPISIPEEEEDNKYKVIKAMADQDLSRKKRMFSPGRRTNYGRKRRDIATVKDQTFGQEHVQVKAESSEQIEGKSEKKSKVVVKAHDALGFAKEQSRTEVIEAPSEKDLSRKKRMFSPGRRTSRKKRMFSPGRRTNFGRKRRDIFDEFKENVWEPKVQIEEKNSEQESRHIPQMGKKEEITSLNTDAVQNRKENHYPYTYTFSPFRGIFLFPFHTGFADFGNHLMVSPTTPRPSSSTTPAPQEASPVHIMECSGTSSSSCYNKLCTVECSDGNKVELDCNNSNSSMVVKTKVDEGKILVSVYCGET